MKTKHRLVAILLIGVIVAVLAYSAGANTNQLSSSQTNFSSLSSQNNANQLKSDMRDAMVNKLSVWAKNHELRIAAYAQSSSLPKLTEQQIDFSNYLSSRNNNMLTAQMRDGVTTQLTQVTTNHEQRLRCIEDGSCLPPATPAAPEQYHCVGSGTVTSVSYRGKLNSNQVGCYNKDGQSLLPKCCNKAYSLDLETRETGC